MAWAYRTSSYANDGTGFNSVNGSGGTVTLAFGAAVSTGDLLVMSVLVAAVSSGTRPTISVKDSVNGTTTYTQVGSNQDYTTGTNNARVAVFYFPNSASGTPTITVTFTGGGGSCFGGVQCAAYSGLATTSTLDVSAAASGTSNAAASGATGSEAASNELVVGVYMDPGNGSTLTAGSGYTSRGKHDSDGGNIQLMLEDKNSSGSTDNATFSESTSDLYTAFCAVFKLSGGAAAHSFVNFQRPNYAYLRRR